MSVAIDSLDIIAHNQNVACLDEEMMICMVLFNIHFTLFEFSLLVLLLLFFIIQLFYYLIIYFRFILYSNRPINSKQHPISVIISARNEAEGLKVHLPKILEQDYPDFEVIVVNDASEDHTDDVLHELKLKYKNLRTTSLVNDKKFTHGKKLALTVGIKAARNEWLVFTDADCYPASNQWLNEFAKKQSDEAQIVLGYGGYESRKGLLNKIIRADTFNIALNYFSFALAGMPYMGVGRNLSYRKSFYFKNNGFSDHAHILSGDDDLFVNANATKKNTSVVFTENSITLSVPKRKFGKWIKQKSRHLSTAPMYKAKHKFFLGLEPFTRIMFYASGITLGIKGSLQILQIVIAIIAFRLILQGVVFKIGQNRLNEKFLFLISLLNDVFLPIIILFLHIRNKVTYKSNKWT